MSASTATMTEVQQPTARSDKSEMRKKIVVLKLASEKLATFLPKSSSSDTKSVASSTSTPDVAMADAQPSIKKASSSDNLSESNSTPAPPTDAPTPAGDAPAKKRKGPLPGTKRGLALGPDGLPKPRGKPGPKKKPRLDDGTIDHAAPKGNAGVTVAAGAHKLGPKANQGAINAGLRALDRSGKPCRKWTRKTFQLKSFTGVMWDAPSWKTPAHPAFTNGEEDSEMNGASQQSSSDIKPNDSSTAMDSNGPDQADRSLMVSTPAASSPGPTTSVVAAAA